MRLNAIAVLIFATPSLILFPALHAQSAPVPPVHDAPTPVLVTDSIETPIQPDEHPLTGGMELGIGSWGPRHSYLTPSIRFAQTLESNPLLTGGSSDSYRGFTSFAGETQLVRYFGQTGELRYAGAARYDSRAAIQGQDKFTNTHNFSLLKQFRVENWNLLFDDEVQYSQGSNFGAAGMEGLGNVLGQLSQWSGTSTSQLASSTLRPDVAPDQSILTGRTGRVSDALLGQAEFHINARDVITAAGTYSLLHFTSGPYNDSRQAGVLGGYNRALSSRDSFGIGASYTHITFPDLPNMVSVATVTGIYARRVSGRLSIEGGIGPQFDKNDEGATSHNHVSWQGHASANYRAKRLMLSTRFDRATSAGSGVLAGATNTQLQESSSFVVSRNWSSAVNFGVSKNKRLDGRGEYNTQFAGVTLTRTCSTYTSIFANYNFERQTAPSNCTANTCSYAGHRNVFGIGLAWNYRPIGIE